LRGTGDFPGIAMTLDLFNWVHGQRCAGNDSGLQDTPQRFVQT